MTDYHETSTLYNTRKKFEIGLNALGLKIPEKPNPTQKIPNRWLLRGEDKSKRLVSEANSEFKPQSGEWGRFGIFMGDCLAPVSFPKSGSLYIFDRDKLTNTKWVCIGSPEYQLLIKMLAKDKSLNLDSIKDGIEAEFLIAHQYYLYEPTTGIVSIPTSLPLTMVSYVLVTPDVKNQSGIQKIPNLIQEKMRVTQ